MPREVLTRGGEGKTVPSRKGSGGAVYSEFRPLMGRKRRFGACVKCVCVYACVGTRSVCMCVCSTIDV